MKRLVLVQLFALAFAGCDVGGLRGNGHVVTEQRNVTPFSSVQISGAFQVEWRSGAPSASLTTDENLTEFVELRVSDDVLYARTTRPLRPTHSIKLLLTSASLQGASFSGASRFNGHQLTGPKFYLETSGASTVTLDGNVDELGASMTGASDLRAEALRTKVAELSVTGAGDARVAVSDTLKISITGAGKVEYTGNPAHIERHITGAGTVKKRD